LPEVADFNVRRLHLAPRWGDPTRICSDIWRQETTTPWACFRDPKFSHFHTIPAGDRHTHTDRQDMHRHTTTAYIALA